MHTIQEKILSTLRKKGGIIKDFTFRALGESVGVSHPQRVKHHLSQLERRGLVTLDPSGRVLLLVNIQHSQNAHSPIVSIPIVGAANCGQPTLFADTRIEGILRISRRIVNQSNDVFAVKAEGSSMNRANIKGLSIDDGDYVVVDRRPFEPQNGDYVLAIIDEMGTIKKFTWEKESGDIVLVSQSSEEHAPIHIWPEDQRMIISGKVVCVIKKPKVNSVE
ncbi:MAG: S24 family peptidase [Candidatus Paceibacterota bacterium]|jgi:repressor LexA